MSEEKKTTTRKKAGRKSKEKPAAPVERAKEEEPQAAPVPAAVAEAENVEAADENGAPDNGSGQSGENPEQAAHAPDQNGSIPEQAAPEQPPTGSWAVGRVLKVTKPLMKGEDVKALQTALIARGYHCGADGASGVFERNTAYAVRCFQSANRLIVDGKAGRFTVAALGGTWNG